MFIILFVACFIAVLVIAIILVCLLFMCEYERLEEEEDTEQRRIEDEKRQVTETERNGQSSLFEDATRNSVSSAQHLRGTEVDGRTNEHSIGNDSRVDRHDELTNYHQESTGEESDGRQRIAFDDQESLHRGEFHGGYAGQEPNVHRNSINNSAGVRPGRSRNGIRSSDLHAREGSLPTNISSDAPSQSIALADASTFSSQNSGGNRRSGKDGYTTFTDRKEGNRDNSNVAGGSSTADQKNSATANRSGFSGSGSAKSRSGNDSKYGKKSDLFTEGRNHGDSREHVRSNDRHIGSTGSHRNNSGLVDSRATGSKDVGNKAGTNTEYGYGTQAYTNKGERSVMMQHGSFTLPTGANSGLTQAYDRGADSPGTTMSVADSHMIENRPIVKQGGLGSIHVAAAQSQYYDVNPGSMMWSTADGGEDAKGDDSAGTDSEFPRFYESTAAAAGKEPGTGGNNQTVSPGERWRDAADAVVPNNQREFHSGESGYDENKSTMDKQYEIKEPKEVFDWDKYF